MKTSQKLLLSAIALIIAALVSYDFRLSAELKKGNYKSPYYDMVGHSFKNFNTIHHNAGNLVGARIQASDTFGVWIDNKLNNRIKLVQTGQTLNIYYLDSDKKTNNISGENIIIHCPILIKLVSREYVTSFDKNTYYNEATTSINGFHQDIPMHIELGNNTPIEINNNSLSILTAIIGKLSSDNSSLRITENNKISVANLKINKYSHLDLLSPNITKYKYSFADSSTVTLRGKIFNDLTKP